MLLSPHAARAARVLVVLSEPMRPSTGEALEGLRSEWSVAIDTVSDERPLPQGAHGVIIAFGGRAASRASEAEGPLVVALAPAYREEGRRTTVTVAMTPAPEAFVALLASAGVHRLLAVRAAPADSDFRRRAASAGKPAGVVIDDRILSDPGDLPEVLRGPGLAADGVWLAPDPGAVTAESFDAARQYSLARAIPFFAPADGLVSGEIRGELTVSFRDCGREAARAARELLAGRAVAKVVYPSAPGKVGVSRSSVPR